MKTFFVYCTDVNTLKICDKYSEDGLSYQDEEYKGELNFKEKEDFINFLNDVGESLESPNYPFSKYPDLEFSMEDDLLDYFDELQG
tara:strand:- start:43 stop:300 length:258 start_codon:yes stop_codon:yes gene_type:complete